MLGVSSLFLTFTSSVLAYVKEALGLGNYIVTEDNSFILTEDNLYIEVEENT